MRTHEDKEQTCHKCGNKWLAIMIYEQDCKAWFFPDDSEEHICKVCGHEEDSTTDCWQCHFESPKYLADKNDQFRKTLDAKEGVVTMTDGVAELAPQVRQKLVKLVQEFNNWSNDNDPYGEHDFGAIQIADTKFFWKIDYYDPALKFGGDPRGEHRKVLTIMYAEEY